MEKFTYFLTTEVFGECLNEEDFFILTGEPSGDKLAAKVISKLKIKDPNISYLCLGGEELKSLGINSIFNMSEVTYLGFTRVIINIFKINRQINETAKRILEFKPDILFFSR